MQASFITVRSSLMYVEIQVQGALRQRIDWDSFVLHIVQHISDRLFRSREHFQVANADGFSLCANHPIVQFWREMSPAPASREPAKLANAPVAGLDDYSRVFETFPSRHNLNSR